MCTYLSINKYLSICESMLFKHVKYLCELVLHLCPGASPFQKDDERKQRVSRIIKSFR